MQTIFLSSGKKNVLTFLLNIILQIKLEITKWQRLVILPSYIKNILQIIELLHFPYMKNISPMLTSKWYYYYIYSWM